MFLSGIADEAGSPLETQIRAHKELGWKHIEIRAVNDTTLALADEKQFEEIRSQLQKAGMQVSCFASRIANWSRDILGPFDVDVDELKRSIPRMKKTEHALYPDHELHEQDQRARGAVARRGDPAHPRAGEDGRGRRRDARPRELRRLGRARAEAVARADRRGRLAGAETRLRHRQHRFSRAGVVRLLRAGQAARRVRPHQGRAEDRRASPRHAIRAKGRATWRRSCATCSAAGTRAASRSSRTSPRSCTRERPPTPRRCSAPTSNTAGA